MLEDVRLYLVGIEEKLCRGGAIAFRLEAVASRLEAFGLEAMVFRTKPVQRWSQSWSATTNVTTIPPATAPVLILLCRGSMRRWSHPCIATMSVAQISDATATATGLSAECQASSFHSLS